MCVQITKCLIKCDFKVLYLFCIRSPWSFLESTAHFCASSLPKLSKAHCGWSVFRAPTKRPAAGFSATPHKYYHSKVPTATILQITGTLSLPWKPHKIHERWQPQCQDFFFLPVCTYCCSSVFSPPTFAISNSSQ